MPPAARVTDMHVCPMVTPGTPPVPHVGGPIIPPCSPNVITGFMPQARVTDMCICVGPPDAILKGSPTVLVNGLMAARIGDTTVHGGSITTGFPTVIIGESSGGGGGGSAPPAKLGEIDFSGIVAGLVETVVSAVESVLPPPDHYGTAIKLDGDAAFRRATIKALDKINSTPTGKALLEAIEKSGKTITIKETAGGNEVTGLSNGAFRDASGAKGAGSNSTVGFNPKRESIGTEPWETRPPAVGLAHELVHAQHAASGDIKTDQVENDSKPDPANPGSHATEMDEEVRTAGIPPYDNEPYSENKIRSEWDPKQPERKWY